jgi:hypothetical protein
VAGPLYEIDLSISIGADETYGPFGWATGDTSNPFGQYQAASYWDLAGYSATWTVRYEDDNVSTILIQLTSSSGAITFTSIAALAGPAAPAFSNAFEWSVSNASSSDFEPGTYYYTMWLTSGGKNTPFLKGRYLVIGAQ